MSHIFGFDLHNEQDGEKINASEFTNRSKLKFGKAVDTADYEDHDVDIIYQHLKDEMRYIPFGDYLKRYIFEKALMKGDYEKIELKEYQQIIIHSFKENNVRPELLGISAKISALAINWLTQLSVSRQIVFWLGFGLNMQLADVSSFLTKALRERDINFKNPDEIIYWYCLKNGYGYPKVNQLKKLYDELSFVFDDDELFGDKTSSYRNIFTDISSDEALLRYLSRFKTANLECLYSITAYQHFENLYKKCQELIAYNNNLLEQDELKIKIERIRDSVKPGYVDTLTKKQKVWTKEDISEKDIEKVLCCGMPRKKDGHLSKISDSQLSKLFGNKRLSGERLKGIMQKKIAVDRFDLITLNFLLYAEAENLDNKSRCLDFMKNTNLILAECSMEGLYIANPYECFVLMCVLSDGPLSTYNDVWEKSFIEP